ncbi:B12-binding domain-containing radical SAM protein [Bacteroidales bacterium OttesenSCG-928-I21]|nr:B12-binding domain-containing radical SAM protein [Bacteroidales bacterium OttesenSCG-928-I21]
MKTVLTTLNAKYIHTSLALRWLYVVNKEYFDISIKEYVIKEDISKIATDLLLLKPDVIGISVYIWNVEKTSQLISYLKSINQNLIIIVGGPEVSYDPEYFLNNWSIDYVVSGEGEFVLGNLLSEIEKTKINVSIESVSSHNHISKIQAKADLENLTKYESPYMLDFDVAERKNRLLYFETSRGCPYKCSYCLSSLEKNIRYFPIKYIKSNLKKLIDTNVRQVKFLDRTFNLNKYHTNAIFDFLCKQYRSDLSFQFEIYADLLNDEIIYYLNKNIPANYFRFEIGIQSTYEPTNKAVNRIQNFELLESNIKKLISGEKIALHLDLIAGLPYETFERFRKSFNDVFSLGAKEVQLGFLKLLRGTALRNDAAKFEYVYNQKAPYEIISNAHISKEGLLRIHIAEYALEKYWNSGKFKLTMQKLFDTHYKNQYFELFYEIGNFYYEHNLPKYAYTLEDLFFNLYSFLLSKKINLFFELRIDYYSCFKVRPHGFWKQKIDKKNRRRLALIIGNDKKFLQQHNLTRKIIEKQTAIDHLHNDTYLLTVFCSDKTRQNPLFLYYDFTKH